ncbi:hypothetical protein VTH06DRAFT_4515 [Thermothelomyces fergusii]
MSCNISGRRTRVGRVAGTKDLVLRGGTSHRAGLSIGESIFLEDDMNARAAHAKADHSGSRVSRNLESSPHFPPLLTLYPTLG